MVAVDFGSQLRRDLEHYARMRSRPDARELRRFATRRQPPELLAKARWIEGVRGVRRGSVSLAETAMISVDWRRSLMAMLDGAELRHEPKASVQLREAEHILIEVARGGWTLDEALNHLALAGSTTR